MGRGFFQPARGLGSVGAREAIGVGDRGRTTENWGKYFSFFSSKYYVKFGHFVNFSYIYFRAKMSCPQS